MERREFLRLSAGLLAASQLPLRLNAEVTRNVGRLKPLDIRPITIQVGAERPFGAVHVSDTHLTLADNRNDERKITLASSRARGMHLGEHYLDEAIRYAKEHDMMLIHTGDLIDFVSEANLDAAARHYLEGDWFVSSGNHEFSQYVGEAKEDEAYKHQSYQKVQEAYPNDLTFCSRVVNGVNLVSLDNVYYNVTERQHELMEQEVKRGLPIVLMCHVPFYTPKLCAYSFESAHHVAAYVCGAPLEVTETYQQDPNRPPEEAWRNRNIQQRADKPTLEFIKWLGKQKLLKGILCGHCHFFFQEPFSKTAVQYVVGATYKAEAYGVSFV